MSTRAGFLGLNVACLFLAIGGYACGGDSNPFKVKSERVITADHADAIVFAPDGRLFYAEQLTGNIRVVGTDGTLLSQPFAHVDVALWVEWGLTGLALDPDFAKNHYVYAFYTKPVTEQPLIGRPEVVRFTDQGNKGTAPEVIVGDLPETIDGHQGFNANGKIHFGADGFLYISMGDYDVQADQPLHPSQDLTKPIGKLLRVNKTDGSAAPGNPALNAADADPRIFAYGFRGPFDFVFHPQTKAIYGTDNTPVSCEELNIIKAGGNYGWPNVGKFPFDDCTAGNQVQAIHHFAKNGMQPNQFLSFVQVSALDFASAAKYPTMGDSLLVCEFADESKVLRRLVLGGAALDQVTADDVVVKDCKLNIAISPDGTIYYSNDTEIRRLTSEQAK